MLPEELSPFEGHYNHTDSSAPLRLWAGGQSDGVLAARSPSCDHGDKRGLDSRLKKVRSPETLVLISLKCRDGGC